MIQPINQNLNIASSNSLSPVEIPHFTGKTKSAKSKADTFVKKSKLEKAPAKTAKKAVKNTKTKAQEIKFKKDVSEVATAAANGAKEGLYVLADITKKGVEFTGAFIKSVFNDSKDIIREKGYKTISAIDSVV